MALPCPASVVRFIDSCLHHMERPRLLLLFLFNEVLAMQTYPTMGKGCCNDTTQISLFGQNHFLYVLVNQVKCEVNHTLHYL